MKICKAAGADQNTKISAMYSFGSRGCRKIGSEYCRGIEKDSFPTITMRLGILKGKRAWLE